MNLGEKIKTYRIENKVTQEKLSKLMGVSRSSISDTENGRLKGTIDFINKLASATNTTLSYWTDGVDTDSLKYNQYEALDILLNSLIDTGIIMEDGKLNDIAQKLVINIIEKEIIQKIKNKGEK